MEFAHDGDNPFTAMARLHEGPDIIYARSLRRGVSGWILTRFAHQQEAFRDYARFSARDFTSAAENEPEWEYTPIQMDPPKHTPYRRLLDPWFTPRAVAAMEQDIRSLCRDLIDRIEDKEEIDFVNDFARYFPTTIFLRLMGMPVEKLDQFLEWEWAHIHGSKEEALASHQAIAAYMASFIEERRNNPKDDLTSFIIASEINGERMSDRDVMGICMFFYVAGLDTVVSSLGWHFRHLASDRKFQSALRNNPSDIPKAVEEMLRVYGLVLLPRYVAQDMEFHGVRMKRGDQVLLPACLGNLDPREFENPQTIDIGRKTRHLTMGHGNHLCLGRHLAQLELKIAIEEWLARFGNISLASKEKPNWHGPIVLGLENLPMRLGR